MVNAIYIGMGVLAIIGVMSIIGATYLNTPIENVTESDGNEGISTFKQSDIRTSYAMHVINAIISVFAIAGSGYLLYMNTKGTNGGSNPRISTAGYHV